MMRSKKYDYVYCNRVSIGGFLAKFIKNKSNATFIFNSLGKLVPPSRLFLLRKIYSKNVSDICEYADYYMSIASNCFPENESLIKDKKMILKDYPGIELLLAPKSFRAKGHVNIGMIGYYSKNKNQIFALEILNRMIEKGIDAKAFFIGFSLDGGEYFNLLQERVVKCHMTDNVVF